MLALVPRPLLSRCVHRSQCNPIIAAHQSRKLKLTAVTRPPALPLLSSNSLSNSRSLSQSSGKSCPRKSPLMLRTRSFRSNPGAFTLGTMSSLSGTRNSTPRRRWRKLRQQSLSWSITTRKLSRKLSSAIPGPLPSCARPGLDVADPIGLTDERIWRSD